MRLLSEVGTRKMRAEEGEGGENRRQMREAE
jgi:hypothetical protein